MVGAWSMSLPPWIILPDTALGPATMKGGLSPFQGRWPWVETDGLYSFMSLTLVISCSPSRALPKHTRSRFNDKVKIAGQVHLRGLLFGKDPLQVFGVLLLLLQQDAIHHFPVHLRPEIDVCAERTVGGIDLIVCQGTVLRGLEPAQPVEQAFRWNISSQ